VRNSPLPLLSVVLPVYNEEAGLRANVQTLMAVLDRHALEFRFELILVNDGSRDGSLALMEELRAERPEAIGVINLLRNFGQVPAIFAGMEAARGECVCVISADLQDPPEMILTLFRHWARGANTILAVRADREDSWPARWASRLFYGAMRHYALGGLPSGGFDFFLLDQSVVERLLENPETNGFLQGQILQASGSTVEIPYKRKQRTAGASGWPFLKKLKYLIDGFTAYSFTPIRLISLIGVLSFLAGVAISIGLGAQRVFFGTRAPGWSSIMIAMFLLHGVEMFMIGVLGEYIWRALDQVRGRPLYIVDYEKSAAHPAAASLPGRKRTRLAPRVQGTVRYSGGREPVRFRARPR